MRMIKLFHICDPIVSIISNADDYQLVEGYLFKGNLLGIPHTSVREVLMCELRVGGLSGQIRRDVDNFVKH